MANHGNTGKRYQLRKIITTTIEDGVYVRRTLACGHSTRANWGTPEHAQSILAWNQEHIEQGKRTRCMECPAGVRS